MTSDYVVVPRVATEEMVKAAYDEAVQNGDYAEPEEFIPRINAAVLEAALSAAPSPWKAAAGTQIEGRRYLLAYQTSDGPVVSEVRWSALGQWVGRHASYPHDSKSILGWMDLPAPPLLPAPPSNPT